MIQDGYSYCSNAWVLDKRIKNELNVLLIISSLCAKTGETFASNKYFANLFDCTEVSISSKIKKLIDLGYIQADYEKRGCEVKSRKIRLKNFLIDNSKVFYPTIKKDFKDNNNINIINNIINNNIQDEEVKKEFLRYVAYRKEIKKPLTKTSVEYNIKKLDRLSKGDDSLKLKIIQQSIEFGWQGLFPLSNRFCIDNDSTKTDDSFFKEIVARQNARYE